MPSSSGIRGPNGIRFQKNESLAALLWEPEILLIKSGTQCFACGVD